MSDETLKLLITTVPSAAALLVTARWMWNIQKAAIARYEHNLQALRSDIVDLERQLANERKERRSDNAHCDEQLTDLRRRMAQMRYGTPPYGNPVTRRKPDD